MWKRVGADKVAYPDDESIEEPKREVKRMNIGNEKVDQRAISIDLSNSLR